MSVDNKLLADAFRAVAELLEQFDQSPGPAGQISLVAWRSGGQAARIVAGMTDVDSEPYQTDATSYLVHRGRLFGTPCQVMESQDD